MAFSESRRDGSQCSHDPAPSRIDFEVQYLKELPCPTRAPVPHSPFIVTLACLVSALARHRQLARERTVRMMAREILANTVQTS